MESPDDPTPDRSPKKIAWLISGTCTVLAAALVVVVLVADLDDNLGEVRTATAALAATNAAGQTLQQQAQAEQAALTKAILAAATSGQQPRAIAAAVYEAGAGTLVQSEQQAQQGVEGIIAQAKAGTRPPARR